MPEYQIKQWDETNSPLDNRYAKAAYAQGLWSKLSNQVRLRALYSEGGIYLDTDVEVLKTFDPLLRHNCFLGFQQKEEHTDWVNNAVLGAQAGNPFVRRCLEVTEQRFTDTGDFYRSPTATTMVLKEMGLREYGLQEIDELTIYPTEYFYPYPWIGTFSTDCITANTYCIHHWSLSWKEKPSRTRSTLKALKRIGRRLLQDAKPRV